MLTAKFFARDPQLVARELLGKIIRVRHGNAFLSARIIETEAYYLQDKASHASLGFTLKRKALFMPAGTIYMYYARGGDSLNISCEGEGNAVLIKSAYPYFDTKCHPDMLTIMQKNNPPLNHPDGVRPIEKLCSGQTLLCKSLGLRVPDWNQKQLNQQFFIEDVGYMPQHIVQTTRLGIPKGRDEDLLYRFIDIDFMRYCTKKAK